MRRTDNRPDRQRGKANRYGSPGTDAMMMVVIIVIAASVTSIISAVITAMNTHITIDVDIAVDVDVPVAVYVSVDVAIPIDIAAPASIVIIHMGACDIAAMASGDGFFGHYRTEDGSQTSNHEQSEQFIETI